MKRSIFLTSFFSNQRSGSKFLTSAAILVENCVVSNREIVETPLRPSQRPCHVSSVPVPSAVTNPTPVTTTLRFCKIQPLNYDFGRWSSMYLMASFTVVIFSASSSGISRPNPSSSAITSSTVSNESAPRSSMKEAVGVTSDSSTPSCSTMICLTLSSTEEAILKPSCYQYTLFANPQ